jgi:hypothetical protein
MKWTADYSEKSGRLNLPEPSSTIDSGALGCHHHAFHKPGTAGS